jgi:hypothetical protein
MTNSDDAGTTRIEQVDTTWTWDCGHDAPKLLGSLGEERPVTRTTYSPVDGVEVPVEYVEPDAPVTYTVCTVCSQCGAHEVWTSPDPIVVAPPPPPVEPPPPIIDVAALTFRPHPAEPAP